MDAAQGLDCVDESERFPEAIRDAQDFARSDLPSQLIGKADERELSLDEADEVAAAAGGNTLLPEAEEDSLE